MRDINRIRPFCERLIKAWESAPDLRFGQLIENVFRSSSDDQFYIEDDEMIERIEAFVRQFNMLYR